MVARREPSSRGHFVASLRGCLARSLAVLGPGEGDGTVERFRALRAALSGPVLAAPGHAGGEIPERVPVPVVGWLKGLHRSGSRRGRTTSRSEGSASGRAPESKRARRPINAGAEFAR